MTAVENRGEYADCITCNGAGVLGTGDREHETGVYVTVDCSHCDGDGTVDAEWVETCEICETAFWTGDGCSHDGVPRCGECIGHCTDCMAESSLDSYEASREAFLFGVPS